MCPLQRLPNQAKLHSQQEKKKKYAEPCARFLNQIWRWSRCPFVYICLFILKCSQRDPDAQLGLITDLSDFCALFYVLLGPGIWEEVVLKALIN